MKNERFLLDTREKVFNSFKSNIFPGENSTSEPTHNPTVFYTPERTKVRIKISKHKISPFELNYSFVNEIRNDEENIKMKYLKNVVSIRIHHS